MPRSNLALALLNALGGAAVLASYAYAFSYSSELRTGLWGGVPASLQPIYTINMLLAAAGYFPFTWLFVVRTKPDAFRAITGFDYALLFVLYALVLIASALWLPMTARMLLAPDPQLWFGIRFVLALVAIGSTGILLLAFRFARTQGGVATWAAAIGAIPFFVQTAILDAIVWPAYFPQ